MIDVHCHLNFNAFKDDYDEVIKSASASGVTKIINVGTKLDTSQKALELAQMYENLYAIVGVHPHHADKVELGSHWLRDLEVLAKKPKVVAIGEIGMDNYRYQTNGIVDVPLQKQIFEVQIDLSHRLKLPLQIHNRHAGKDIIEILYAHKNVLQNPPGMFHCMSGDLKLLKRVLDLGFYVGFDGNITYGGLAPGEDTDLKDLVKATPLDRIVVETDSPYLSPVPFRGERNEPKNAIIVADFIAALKGSDPQVARVCFLQNTHALFNV
jgi:TatD DNase family protein